MLIVPYRVTKDTEGEGEGEGHLNMKYKNQTSFFLVLKSINMLPVQLLHVINLV